MNKEEFVRSKFRNILSETIDERVKNIEKNLYDDTDYQGYGKFDYVEEKKDSVCENCGSTEMREGECRECGYKSNKDIMEFELELDEKDSVCENCGSTEMREGECRECGYKESKDIMELGGMDDGHPRFGNKNLSKMSRKKKDDLIGDRDYEDSFDDFEEIKFRPKRRKSRKEDDETEFELELDESECNECGSSYEMKEKLYGKQHKLDRNKNGKIDKEDFRMLRKNRNEDEQLYEVEFEKEEFYEESKPDFLDLDNDGNKKESMKSAAKSRKNKKSLKETILYTESDLLNLIERLVLEEKKKFKKSEPKGYREYQKVHKADKKENEKYLKSVAKKMTDYLKGASDKESKYEMSNTSKFPTENGGLKKGIRKKYTPSDAVDDYEDAFSYPGMTNLVFDEIKPSDKNIEKYLKGHRSTGNAQVDDDGNPLGNVVPSDVGDKFFTNYKENLYGQEQMNASYKRQPQPVDQAGEETERGSLKSKRGKKSSQSILNKVDESILYTNPKLNEEFSRMNELIDYNRKTQ